MSSSSNAAPEVPLALLGKRHPWHRLSVVPEKQMAYVDDGYFREGWADISQICGPQVTQVLYRTALVLLKPEAFYGGKARLALTTLEARGFSPIAIAPVLYNARLIHGVWQYNTNLATEDRILLQTRYNCPRTTVVIALADLRPEAPLPASIRLKFLKGSAAPEGRRPDSLRAILHSPNGLLNFVHSPEEPADVVRELAVYLDALPRLAFLEAITRHKYNPSIVDCIRTHEADLPDDPLVLDPHAAAKRIASAAELRVMANPQLTADYRCLSTYVADVVIGKQIFFLTEFERLLRPFGLTDLHREIYVFGTYFISYNLQGREPWYSEKTLARWYQSAIS